MRRKAQVEFIVIFGVVLLALVAIIFAVQPESLSNPIPSAIAQQHKTVSESVLNFGKTGADKLLDDIETHGGYLTLDYFDGGAFPVPHAVYLNEGVPYWQACQETHIPTKLEIAERFSFGLEKYFHDNIDSLEQVLPVNATFDKSQLSVTTNILDDRIIFSITLPTTIGDHRVTEPYRLVLSTRFGRIYDFARDFSKESSSKRFFEYFSISSMILSKYAPDGEQEIPTLGFLEGCGKVLFRDPARLSRSMKDMVLHTLSQTELWKDFHVDPDRPKSYAIPSLTSQETGQQVTYPDLDINFYLPDNFNFLMRKPVIVTSTEVVWERSIFRVPACGAAYFLKYNLKFPVIIRVKDDLSGNSFYFSTIVFIEDPQADKEMQPGSCNVNTPFTVSGATICEDLKCSASLKVQDSLGQPVQGAQAVYDGCYIGETDITGSLDGPISCNDGQLTIHKSGNRSIVIENTTSTEISKTYTLHNIQETTIHFRNAEMRRIHSLNPGFPYDYLRCQAIPKPKNKLMFLDLRSKNWNYTITNTDPNYVPDGSINCTADPVGCANDFEVTDKVTINYIPEQQYEAESLVFDLNPGAFTSFKFLVGGFHTTYHYPAFDKDIFVYIPDTGENTGSVPEKQAALTTMRNSCEFEPFKEDVDHPYKFSYAFNGCHCNALHKIVVEDLITYGCLPYEYPNSKFTVNTIGNYGCDKAAIVNDIETLCPANIVGSCA